MSKSGITKRPVKRTRKLPHADVYVRLKPSKIHGIGVFAIREIPKGVDVFGEDDEPFVRVPARTVRALRGEMRRLYDDFCVLEEEEFWCPVTFNALTISWYLNHSARPNVDSVDGLRFVSRRRIRQGEELTADYTTYSEGPPPGNAPRRRRRRRASVASRIGPLQRQPRH